jgi:uncharacterized membrane protein
MFTALFWKDAAERVLATMAQTLLALLTADGFDVLQADFNTLLVTVVVAGVLSLLKALVAGSVVNPSVSPASLAPDDRGV